MIYCWPFMLLGSWQISKKNILSKIFINIIKILTPSNDSEVNSAHVRPLFHDFHLLTYYVLGFIAQILKEYKYSFFTFSIF